MKTKQQEKRPYKKPELMQVPLRPEEAVLGNCKMSGGAQGPGQGTCTTPVPCSAVGS
jgi:hypothetical protein